MQQAKDMSNYRFEQSEQCLVSAKTLIQVGDYKGASNRSYYCVFHAVRSVLAYENIDFKRHSAVIAYFRKKYIKTEIFAVRMSDILGELFTVRNRSDYDDFYVISREDVINQLESAEHFMNEVRKYLNAKAGESF